jgi:sterol desaturase/sphingolipid hydroxylase (fatty acid hydroxylase superfamily)
VLIPQLSTFLVVGATCVVLERLVPLHRGQKIWRADVAADLTHYVVNSFIAGLALLVLLAPVMVLVAAMVPASLRAAVAAAPLWQQLVALTVVSDVGIYVGHRLTHVIPWLWRFHAIHHSATEVDWLTASRNHPVDLVFVRSWMLLPGYALGISGHAFGLYAAYFAAQSLFLHANVRLPLGPLSVVYAGPEYHRWHHSDAPEARDKNFVSHFPWLDLLFGTFYLPKGKRPERYGTPDPVRRGYLRHLVHPFGR